MWIRKAHNNIQHIYAHGMVNKSTSIYRTKRLNVSHNFMYNQYRICDSDSQYRLQEVLFYHEEDEMGNSDSRDQGGCYYIYQRPLFS